MPSIRKLNIQCSRPRQPKTEADILTMACLLTTGRISRLLPHFPTTLRLWRVVLTAALVLAELGAVAIPSFTEAPKDYRPLPPCASVARPTGSNSRLNPARVWGNLTAWRDKKQDYPVPTIHSGMQSIVLVFMHVGKKVNCLVGQLWDCMGISFIIYVFLPSKLGGGEDRRPVHLGPGLKWATISLSSQRS